MFSKVFAACRNGVQSPEIPSQIPSKFPGRLSSQINWLIQPAIPTSSCAKRLIQTVPYKLADANRLICKLVMLTAVWASPVCENPSHVLSRRAFCAPNPNLLPTLTALSALVEAGASSTYAGRRRICRPARCRSPPSREDPRRERPRSPEKSQYLAFGCRFGEMFRRKSQYLLFKAQSRES